MPNNELEKKSNRLLSCPFCGGEAKYIEDKDFFVSRFVTCTKCGIETRRNYLRKDLAIKDWNTRKPIERIVEQLEDKMLTSSSAKAEAIIGMLGASANFYSGEFEAYKDAIEIVKGGVDNAE